MPILKLPIAGRRCIGESTHIARIIHDCSILQPECADPTIFPGDRYIRTVWLYWRNLGAGNKHSWVMVQKQHDHPRCSPHPTFFEDDSLADHSGAVIRLAA